MEEKKIKREKRAESKGLMFKSGAHQCSERTGKFGKRTHGTENALASKAPSLHPAAEHIQETGRGGGGREKTKDSKRRSKGGGDARNRWGRNVQKGTGAKVRGGWAGAGRGKGLPDLGGGVAKPGWGGKRGGWGTGARRGGGKAVQWNLCRGQKEEGERRLEGRSGPVAFLEGGAGC